MDFEFRVMTFGLLMP